MENKKMYAGLIRQIIYEVIILAIAYLFIGNNFGNNFVYEWGMSLVEKYVDSSMAMGLYYVLLIPSIIFSIPIAVISLALCFLPVLAPILLTCMFLLNNEFKSYVKAYLGKPSDEAVLEIKEWYKKTNVAYLLFVIISRVLFVLLLLFKALSAPVDFAVEFIFFKWQTNGKLLGVMIFVVGFFMGCLSCLIVLLKRRIPKNLDRYVCPICHKFAKGKVIDREKIQDAEYDTYETSSGYYTRDTVGELVTSSGEHIADVEGDVWVDTSRTHVRKTQPTIYRITTKYEPCGCVIEKEEARK